MELCYLPFTVKVVRKVKLSDLQVNGGKTVIESHDLHVTGDGTYLCMSDR